MIPTLLLVLCVSMVVSLVLTAALRRLAVARGWFDSPTEARKIHTEPTPRIGGVAIAIAFFVPVLSLSAGDQSLFGPSLDDPQRLFGLLSGAAILVCVGLFDDLRGLSAWPKLLAQLLVATLAYNYGFEIRSIGNPVGAPVELGWLAFPVTVVWIVGVTNAINLIDGLDGLAAGVSLLAVLTLLVISVVDANPVVGLTMAALAGALLGFLRHNFNPASIFMGDSGSLFLGYTLATTAIWGSTKSSTVVSLTIPLLCLGVPIADAALAILRRFARGTSVLSADRGHIHHKLIDRGMSPRQAVLTLYVGTAGLALAALGLELGNGAHSGTVLVVVTVLGLITVQGLGIVSWRRASRAVRFGLLRKRRTVDRVRTLDEFGKRVRSTRSLAELHEALLEMSVELDVSGMRCRIGVDRATAGDHSHRYEWTWGRPSNGDPSRTIDTGDTNDPRCTNDASDTNDPRRTNDASDTNDPRRTNDASDTNDPNSPGSAEEVVLHFPLDGHEGAVTLTGTLSFHWRCPRALLQIPEQPLYEWFAHVLRVQLLTLCGPTTSNTGRELTTGSSHPPTPPRVAAPSTVPSRRPVAAP